jgi:DNA repair exonuclease SbcCD nuclease subunit
MDYWALGHIHKREILNNGHPCVVYPGNLQGRSLKASERGPKGAYIVDVEENVVTTLDFVPLDRVRPLVLEVDIGGLEDIPELSRVLLEEATRAREGNEGRSLLIRAVLRGKGKLHHDLRRPGRLDELVVDLRDAVKGEAFLVWWESLVDETRPELDLEAIAARGDFSSEVLRGARAMGSSQGEVMTQMDLESRPLQRMGIRRWIGDPTPEDEGIMLNSAVQAALELLEEPADQ